MSEPFLSKAEIAKWTRTPQKRRQVQFLIRNGIRHQLDNDGWPVVTWAAVEGRTETAQSTPTWTPNKAA